MYMYVFSGIEILHLDLAMHGHAGKLVQYIHGQQHAAALATRPVTTPVYGISKTMLFLAIFCRIMLLL